MKLLKASLAMSIIFLFGVGINMYRFGYGFEDGFFRTLLAPMEGTVWADGFSEEAFDKISIGMTAEQVFSILGEPLEKDSDCHKLCFWTYSWQDTQTADFDQRWVVFNSQNQVIEKRKSFFID
ncbi:MAG: outer membrane protein assembly factor BamE domain-containing protein [Bacteriovoracaceae bacterium]